MSWCTDPVNVVLLRSNLRGNRARWGRKVVIFGHKGESAAKEDMH